MRIALLSAEYPPQCGGVGDYTRCLGRALVTRGHTVGVITGKRDKSLPPEHDPLALIDVVPSWDMRCWPKLATTLRVIAPDIFHIQYQTGAYGMHPAINLLPWWLHRHAWCPPIVVTFHDLREPYLFPKAGELRHTMTQRLIRDTDAVVTTNCADAEQVVSIIGQCAKQPICTTIPIGSNIAVAPPPGYQRWFWRAHLGLQPGDMLIAYFGLLSRDKGADVLLQAMVGPSLAKLPLRLILIGGEGTQPYDRAYAAEIYQQIDQLRLRDSILQTGYVDEATVSGHLLAADCVVLPFREGASFRSGSLLAALLHGCPVITTKPKPSPICPIDTNTTFPTLIDGTHALLLSINTSAAVARALKRLLSDSSLQERLRHGAAEVGKHFSWERIAQQHEELYDRLIV